MDQHANRAPEGASEPAEDYAPAHDVLAHTLLRWANGTESVAVLLHAASTMLVLESSSPEQPLPELGTEVAVSWDAEQVTGRLAEHGRNGRFLVSLGTRPVRRALRLRVSLPATLRSLTLPGPQEVEIADLTTGGARVRGVELPVDTQVTLDFLPPGRTQPVTVRASVAHGTHGAARPWIGVTFRLVAMRGGR
jgi:hypothetical protein